MTELEKKNGGRKKFWSGLLLGVIASACVCFGIVAVSVGYAVSQTRGAGAAYSSEEGILDMQEVTQKLSRLERVIDSYYLFEADPEEVENSIYKGMLDGLGDPYSVYYTPEEYRSMTEETEGVYCGIGVLVSQDAETGAVTALRVFPNSPAEEAGMIRGDIIYKVGDIETAAEELDVLVSTYIRGEEGTSVDITVLRGTELIEMTMIRRMVEASTVEFQMMEDRTGYILVSQFEMVTSDQFRAAVDSLEADGMERLIIDLRDNPGGIVDACVDMAAYVLPEDRWDGTILSMADRDGETDRYYCEGGMIRHDICGGEDSDPDYPKEDGHELALPIAVLLNGQSASASEVFAGALRDYEAAILVGTTSFGKGIVQSLLPFEDGSAVKITTAHYYTPAGLDLHKTGLAPDVEVELELDEDLTGVYDVPLERDNQVMAAVEALKNR